MSKCEDKCTPYNGPFIIPPFWSFTNFTPTIPKLYWNVRSQEQRILNLFQLMGKVICYADVLGENVNELAQEFEELSKKLDDPEFIERYIEILQQWLDEHMPDILGNAMRIVYFGLTLEGYFAGYIPDGNAWNTVMFDTATDYNLDTYGRLMLYYETDSNSTVWQTQAPQEDYTELLARLREVDTEIDNLDERVTQNEHTLYDPLRSDE